MDADMLAQSAVIVAKPTSGNAPRNWAQQSRHSAFVLVGQGLMIVTLLLGSYFFFSHFVVQSVRVSGSSMLPTLRDTDVYLMNRFACLFHAPHRGDIVVLKDPTDQSCAVKRVIGAEGDTVVLRNGDVYLNGQKLAEPYLTRGMRTYPFDSWEQVVRCGPGQFFVLGDNRSHSSDSRTYGIVSRNSILGLVMR